MAILASRPAGVRGYGAGSLVGKRPYTASTRTDRKCARSLERSSKSLVYTTSPRDAAEAITIASTTVALGIAAMASPAIFERRSVMGSTVKAFRTCV